MGMQERKTGETAAEYAYRLLREQIISLKLEPGAPFSDTEFAKQIGLSRTPVREAVLQLARESRIIKIFPQRGMRISRIQVELVEESRCLRTLLEKNMVEMACDMATEEDIRLLRENIDLQKYYLERGNNEEFLKLDNAMHEKLFLICHRELTYQMCQRLAIHYDRIRSLSVNTVKDTAILSDHEKILKAIASHDKEGAVRQMDIHLNRWQLNEARFREQYPDYFQE